MIICWHLKWFKIILDYYVLLHFGKYHTIDNLYLFYVKQIDDTFYAKCHKKYIQQFVLSIVIEKFTTIVCIMYDSKRCETKGYRYA